MSTIIDDCHQDIDFDGVVLGCTELSIIHQNFAITSPDQLAIIDPIAILAQQLISAKI